MDQASVLGQTLAKIRSLGQGDYWEFNAVLIVGKSPLQVAQRIVQSSKAEAISFITSLFEKGTADRTEQFCWRHEALLLKAQLNDQACILETLFTCPITQDLMRDPVVAADGCCYERSAIGEWLHTHNTSPISRKPMARKGLIHNLVLRNAIQECCARQRSAAPVDDTLQS